MTSIPCARRRQSPSTGIVLTKDNLQVEMNNLQMNLCNFITEKETAHVDSYQYRRQMLGNRRHCMHSAIHDLSYWETKLKGQLTGRCQ